MEDATSEASLPISYVDKLPTDGEVPDEVLEFFIPEAEEHLQVVTECLLMLEANSKAEDINRLFRAMHTVKGSAAQVGLHRLSAVAHRVEDLIGELRDGHLRPNADIIDICLQSVDVLKKLLHRQWESDAEMRAAINPLLARIEELAPEEEIPETSDISHNTAASEESRKQPVTESAAGAAPSATQQVLPQAKSVRISLDRLDRMMNAVGELVINRTRMLGRLSELGKLVEILNFSKSRLSGKVGDFQEKHEFNRIRATLMPGSHPPQRDTFRGTFGHMPELLSGDALEFSDLEMDRYDDFNILSRSLTEISADVTEVLRTTGRLHGPRGFGYRRVHKIGSPPTRRNHRQLAWCRSATFTRVFRGR